MVPQRAHYAFGSKRAREGPHATRRSAVHGPTRVRILVASCASMRTEELTIDADDGVALHVYHWSPDAKGSARGVVHISHGMAEHAARYARLAEALTNAGFEVYANDH